MLLSCWFDFSNSATYSVCISKCFQPSPLLQLLQLLRTWPGFPALQFWVHHWLIEKAAQTSHPKTASKVTKTHHPLQFHQKKRSKTTNSFSPYNPSKQKCGCCHENRLNRFPIFSAPGEDLLRWWRGPWATKALSTHSARTFEVWQRSRLKHRWPKDAQRNLFWRVSRLSLQDTFLLKCLRNYISLVEMTKF